MSTAHYTSLTIYQIRREQQAPKKRADGIIPHNQAIMRSPSGETLRKVIGQRRQEDHSRVNHLHPEERLILA